MRKSAVSKKSVKSKAPDDKKSVKKGAQSRNGSSSSQRQKEDAAVKKQNSNASKKEVDAISAKNAVLDNESQGENPPPVEETPDQQPVEEEKA